MTILVRHLETSWHILRPWCHFCNCSSVSVHRCVLSCYEPLCGSGFHSFLRKIATNRPKCIFFLSGHPTVTYFSLIDYYRVRMPHSSIKGLAFLDSLKFMSVKAWSKQQSNAKQWSKKHLQTSHCSCKCYSATGRRIRAGSVILNDQICIYIIAISEADKVTLRTFRLLITLFAHRKAWQKQKQPSGWHQGGTPIPADLSFSHVETSCLRLQCQFRGSFKSNKVVASPHCMTTINHLDLSINIHKWYIPL